MTLIAVLDAQLKNPTNAVNKDEQRKRWWKRRKKNHQITTNDKVQTAFNG
jgi:hypothetical protein